MQKLDNILDDYVASGDDTKDKLLGAAFLVVDKDGILYQGSAGRTAGAIDSPSFSVNSFNWIASMTKIVTATCLMQLVERGQIQLDDDVRPLVSELAKMQILRGFTLDGEPILTDNVMPITLRHLLTHTVGLGIDTGDPDLIKWAKAVGRTTTITSYTLEGFNTPLKFAPGEGWYYGSAMDWAGHVLEKITGQTLGQYMAEHIFKPLAMHDTTFRPLSLAGTTQDRTVQFSLRDAETGTLSSVPPPIPTDPPLETGGSGLWTTAADFGKVLQGLLRAGLGLGHGPGALVSRETVDEMLRPQLDDAQRQMLKMVSDAYRVAMISEFPEGTPLDHGISGIINTQNVPGKRRKGSMMWQGMTNGHWWIDRESGIAATLIVNVLPQPDLTVNRLFDELERAVYADLLPAPHKPI